MRRCAAACSGAALGELNLTNEEQKFDWQRAGNLALNLAVKAVELGVI